MSIQPPEPDNPSKPVAYDPYGRPLYAHPAREEPPVPQLEPVQSSLEHPSSAGDPNSAPLPAPNKGKPQVVYMSRATDPHPQELSPAVKVKHQESVKKYPHLNLSESEFVISAVRRHPIGLVSIWGVVIVVFVLLLVLPSLLLSLDVAVIRWSPSLLVSGGFVLLMGAVLAFLAGVLGTYVYDANRFYLTNESVTQHIQTSLFTSKNQTISLANVEDASYRQSGIVQTILNYGSIRLSTQGEETTYRFNFVANPQKQIRLLNDAVEAFKNFRPVSVDDDDGR